MQRRSKFYSIVRAGHVRTNEHNFLQALRSLPTIAFSAGLVIHVPIRPTPV